MHDYCHTTGCERVKTHKYLKPIPYLDGGTKENCGIAVVSWDGWSDWLCKIPPEHFVQCVCEKPSPVYLKLRGRCPDSAFDTYWTPQTYEGQYFLHGIKSSEVRFDRLSQTWQLIAHGGVEKSFASSDAAFHSFLLGKSTWSITNDTGEIIISCIIHFH